MLEELDRESFYNFAECVGLDYGANFQFVQQLRRGSFQIEANVEIPAAVQQEDRQHALHPSILDSTLHSGLALGTDLRIADRDEGRVLLPTRVKSLRFGSGLFSNVEALTVHAWCRSNPEEEGTRIVDLVALTRSGELVYACTGLRLESIGWEKRVSDTDQTSNIHFSWSWKEAPPQAVRAPDR
ncbi:MAG: polyketide synthase dehydratase domain-containing protein, partial [Bradymonadaceae bacterium]